MVGEGFGFACLIVRLPLQLDEHRRGLLQVLVSVLWSLEHDGELMTEGSHCYSYCSTTTESIGTTNTVEFLSYTNDFAYILY